MQGVEVCGEDVRSKHDKVDRKSSLHARRKDRGDAGIEIAILFPVILVITLLVLQAAVTWAAHNNAEAAATIAVRSARIEGATNADGVKAGKNALVGGILSPENPKVNVTRNGHSVTATVSGSAPLLGSWFPSIRIIGKATASIENFDSR